MKKVCLTIILALSATSSIAADSTLFECKMTRECIAGENCTETQFEFQAAKPADATLPFRFLTPAETIDGIALRRHAASGGTSLLGRSGTATYLLDITGGGSAVWLVHLPDAEMVITYFGSCSAG